MITLVVLSLVFLFKFLVKRLKARVAANNLQSSYYLEIKEKHPDKKIVGFFHPYCNAGGGGERVLWCAVNALLSKYPSIHIAVYTGDQANPGDIIANAKAKFGIAVDAARVTFVFLSKREWVEDKHYPRLTMLRQSIGSMVLGWEAINLLCPDVFIDSMGYAFTLPIFAKLGSSHVACYVHYPTISSDMLNRVQNREEQFNNNSAISKSSSLSLLKVLYYRIFARLYRFFGSYAEIIMVNSSWTKDHIVNIWKKPDQTSIIYPPCDVSSFTKLPLEPRDNILLSVGQFRPEKNHRLQLESFAKFLQESSRTDTTLVIVGGCRHDEDRRRVDELKQLARDLKIEEHVEFKVDLPYPELLRYMGRALVGLHSMRDEHFGISVVELMAAGTVVVAHNSAGPRLDIVVEHNGARTGYLADSVETYAQAFHEVFSLSSKQRQLIQESARASVSRFSEAEFSSQFLEATKPLFVVPVLPETRN